VIEETIEDTSKDDQSFVRTINRYQVDLRYAYEVGKRDFVGSIVNWSWGTVYGLREQAETVAGRYVQGQGVTVYYDPEEPRNAVLEPGSRKGAMAPLVFGVVAAVIGAVTLKFLLQFGFDV
jgi:hypothetical protein